MRTPHRYRTLAREAFFSDTSDKLDSAAFIILLVFVAAVPFLYGVSPSDRHVVRGGTVLAVGNFFLEPFAFILAAVSFLSKSRVRSSGTLAVPIGAVICLALLGLVQSVPLPSVVLERIAPVDLKIYHESAQVLRLFGKEAPAPRISIAPTETSGTVLLILACVALFLATTALLANRLRRRVFSLTLLGSATLSVLTAAILKFPEDRANGPFVGYLEITLAFAFGSLWAEMLTGSDRAEGTADRAERFERRLVPISSRIALWCVIAVGIWMTQSRGAILSAGITTLALLALAVLHRSLAHSHWRLAVGVGIFAGIVVVAAKVGVNPVVRYLESDPRELGASPRVALWNTSLQAWREFPLLGSGLGTFPDVFRRVQPRELSGLVEQAHSDLLQVLVTGGMIGAALAVIAVGSLFVLLVRAWRAQKHREESAMVLAGFGALLSLTLHSLVDLSFSIPSILATLACALGATWAAGRDK